MSKFVRNDAGTVHSVDDSFTTPEGWDEVDEAAARAENPALFGEQPVDPPAAEPPAADPAAEQPAAEGEVQA